MCAVWKLLWHNYNHAEDNATCVNTTVSSFAFSLDGFTWVPSPIQPYTSQVTARRVPNIAVVVACRCSGLACVVCCVCCVLCVCCVCLLCAWLGGMGTCVAAHALQQPSAAACAHHLAPLCRCRCRRAGR